MTGIELQADGAVYDLLVSNGGISVAETTAQNQTLLFVAHKGVFKEHPTIGVGIADMVDEHDFSLWKREIISQLEADGQRVSKLSITNEGIELEANY